MQQPKTFQRQMTKTVGLSYLLYLPPGYDEKQPWPTILFLHGMGERGDDLEKVKVHGIPKKLEAGEDMPFIVISPQCPMGSFWTLETDALNALLDEVIDHYAIDTDRLYLTGLSMGGYGTWQLGTEYPERFAAVAPICGGGFPERAVALKDTPVWVFHGDKDEVVLIRESQEMVDALEACGAKDVQFTVYPGVGHDSWTQTYDNPKLYNWFLSHRRG
jgi:predicted peptidase